MLKRTEIDLQLSLSNLELFLKIERILASFNLSRKLPLVKELLTKSAKGSDIRSFIIFKTVTAILYGPEDLLHSYRR